MSSKRSGKPRVPGSPAAAFTRTARPQGGPVITAPPPVPADPGVPGVPQDVLRMLSERLEALVMQNVADVQAMQAGGFTFQAEQLINGRIDCLMNSIAQAFGPQGQLWLLQARLAFEEAMAENIVTAREQGRKGVLAQGGTFTAGAIRNLARATGTYGG